MLQLLGNRIQGQVMGKPVAVQTLPTAFAGGRIKGAFRLLPPGADPVFGDFVMAVPVSGVAAGGDRQAYDPQTMANPQPGAARSVEWKMPVGARADIWKTPVGARADIWKTPLPSAGGAIVKMPAATRVDPMKIRTGADAWKVTMPGGGASFPKMRMPADPEPSTFKGGSGDIPIGPVVLAQRLIPGRNCLVVVSGFADLLDVLRAAGGADLTIV